VTRNRHYNVYGADMELKSSQDSMVDALDKQFGFFLSDYGEPHLSLEIGPLPESISLSGSSPLGGNLFYDVRENKTIILREEKPNFTSEDVLYVILGDIRSSSKITVYVPNVKTRRYPKWMISAHHLLTKNFVNVPSKLITDYVVAGHILSRIIEPCLYYSLPNRGFSFLHASGVSKEKGIAFFGPSNIGKSSIALEMVKRGWQFLGDDLIVIDGNHKRVLPYPKPVKLEGQTLAAHPHLFEGLSANMGTIDKFALKRFMDKALEKPFKTALDASINELFRDAKICQSSNLDYVVRLTRTGVDKPTIRDIDLDACVKSLSVGLFWEFNMQWWRYNEYVYSSSFFSNKDFILDEARHHEKIMDVMSKALSASKAFELQVPNNYARISDSVETLLAKL
jgi:hypothetical protein